MEMDPSWTKERTMSRVKAASRPGGRRLTGKALYVAYSQFKANMRKSPDVMKVVDVVFMAL